jgi:GxxExxY protein
MSATAYTGVYGELTGEIISAAMEVHTELGCGLKEEAYEAALSWELEQRGHKVQRQVPCPVKYKGNVFCQDDEHPKRIDLLVDDTIVVELKAVCTKHPVFAAQCRTYLRMLDLPVGLVLNFAFPTLKEGIEHVSNPKSIPPHLPNSQTPRSESNISARIPFGGQK